MISASPTHTIDEGDRVRGVGLCPSISRAVRTDQSAGSSYSSICSLSGKGKTSNATRDIERQSRQVNPRKRGRHTVNSGESAVVAKLEFVEQRRRQNGLNANHTVLRNTANEHPASCDSLRLVIRSLVSEESEIRGMLCINPIIEAQSEGVFVDYIRSLALDRVEEIWTNSQYSNIRRAKRRN